MYFTKRIAFCISDQHLVPHGGIGQFAKGFVEMSNTLGWKVDIILDKPPTNDFSKLVETLGANIISPKECLSYKNHTGTFAFSDTMNFEKMLNFRNAIMQAFTTNIYDMIVCNSPDSMPAALSFDLAKYIPVVFYTHEESMVFRDTRKFKGVFVESCNEFFNNMMRLDNAFVGTQSIRNKTEIEKNGGTNIMRLSMPMSERKLLDYNFDDSREGVLYIGRWEDRKNPEAFLKVIKETNLPAKIMTNANGKRKFEARLAELKIENYEIKASIVGEEKVKFIQSARVHFNPSLRENYPFTFFECLGNMPCVVIDKSEWVTNFDSKYYARVPLDEAADAVRTAYKITPKKWYDFGAPQYVKDLDENTAKQWSDFMSNFKPSASSKSDAAKINEYETVKYTQFIQDLKRTTVAIDDVKSVLTNKHKYNIIYTNENSYLSKDPGFKPVENKDTNLENLFI
jgi:glycosyltransferase involved in cell wall biosynthesis